MVRSTSACRSAPRVAIVIGQLGHGGAERQVAILAQNMQQRCKFVPVVFCMSDATEPYGSVLSAAGVEWYAAPSVSRPRLWRLLWLVRKLGKSGCSLVYGVLNGGNIYGGAAALVNGLPFIGSIRSANDTLPTSYRVLSGFFARRAQAVVANSPSCLNSLRDVLGVWHERVYVIPNAITLADPTQNARRELRQQWSLPEDAWVIGTIANLKPEKRVEFFLRVAISLLNLDSTNFHFIWIGEGPERLKAESILKALPHLATRIHFPGARLDIANCLAAFDAFVLTSAYEGLPNALLEAMAAGLPCVATDVPGTRDVLEAAPDLEIGLLADANDPARFADTLLELLQDRGRMQQLGQHARQHVRERYGEEAMVNRFCEVFSSVLNNGLTVGAPL